MLAWIVALVLSIVAVGAFAWAGRRRAARDTARSRNWLRRRDDDPFRR